MIILQTEQFCYILSVNFLSGFIVDLSRLYDSFPFGFCVLTRTRKDIEVVYLNKSMRTLLSKRSGETYRGELFHEIWPGKETKAFLKQLKSPKPPKQYILPFKDRWIQIQITSGEWEGQPCHLVWAMDISTLKEDVARADAVAEMKSNFLATMSHEIRTPMQTIYGFLELITEEKPGSKVQSMVDTAQKSAASLLEILDDILDLAKMDAEKMELDVFEVPVRMLVRGTLEALAVKAHGPKVDLIDDIAEDVPFVVIGDPKRLRQIIMNLAGNALKFTEKGSVKVRVTTQARHVSAPENGVVLRFEVSDTGIGMSDEVCARLFSSFTQADNTTARKYGGTGLGLSISKKLVALMNGRIGVKSKEGNGSTFWFEIPTEEVSTETTTVNLPDLDGVSILSVEDHPMGAKEIVTSLKSMGATVESCPTYKDGLDLVSRRPFDVAVIDQGLPDGLGLDLIREIMALRPNMGLIMYTVRDDVGLQQSLQALGVTYLAKPASRAGLGEAVKSAVDKSADVSIEGPCRLLIAEDTASVQDVIRRQLEHLGVEATLVSNGQEALEAWKTGAYGLLITDLHMPEIDGYGVVQDIRAAEEGTDRHFPIIALTADVQMAHRDTYLQHGFDECLVKPVSLGQFRRLLARWGLLSEQQALSGSEEDVLIDAGSESAVNVQALQDQMGALDQSTVEMLHMFIEMTAPVIRTIQESGKAKDLHGLAEAAHSLKGAARSACCLVLGDLAAALQEKSESGQPDADLIEKIEAEFERAKDEIQVLQFC